MKDILSMLQSRLAKGSNFINEYSEYSYPFNMIEEQTHADQKLMKQALAEIVSLRRKVSRNCEED